MIFISHNSKDKPIVEPIALKLRDIFGQDEVFYDSWSIQPGDGIIDKMNIGLERCKLFLYFISINSINSYMVKLEWQNAIMKASKGEAKFIPVRIDSCGVPSILMQSLYIDMFTNGFEVALRQIVDVSNGLNIFNPQFQNVKNIQARIRNSKDSKTIEVKIEAKYFMEPIPHFAFITSNSEEQIGYKVPGSSFMISGFNKNALTSHLGSQIIHLNGYRLDFPNLLTPSFPLEIMFYAKTEDPIAILGVMHEDPKDNWNSVQSVIDYY